MILGRKHCGCSAVYSSTVSACPECGASEAFADFIPYNVKDWIYDEETFPNIFTAGFYHVATGTRVVFEISDRKNELSELYEFLMALRGTNCRTVGYNNLGFDYPILHFIIEHFHLSPSVTDIYNKAMSIINTPWNRRFDNVIWDSDMHIQQIDLYKIHHFDNEARSTSLKMLEFNMCMDTIEDLPFPVGTVLDDDQKDTLISYQDHDIYATRDFYFESLDMIRFREEMTEKYHKNFMNHNDTKIGKDYFIMELERLIPGSCYTRGPDGRKPRQTIRSSIALKDVIFDYIKFENPEFHRVHQWLAAQVITETKGVFTDVNATVDGFKFDFGLGGIHGSVNNRILKSNDTHIIIDADVASMYPNIAIANRLYPEHLGEEFCDIYKDVYEQRKLHLKGTAENACLKLALNGVYGDSNNKYSPFYDPKFTMGITINGQLLLCMLAEWLMVIPDMTMISINTDGICALIPRSYEKYYYDVCNHWDEYTGLTLEYQKYKMMCVADVNNYIGVEYEG